MITYSDWAKGANIKKKIQTSTTQAEPTETILYISAIASRYKTTATIIEVIKTEIIKPPKVCQ